MTNLDPKPYWVEESQKWYSRAEILDSDLLWNLARFKPGLEYNQDELKYRETK